MQNGLPFFCDMIEWLLPLQFFPSPVKPDGQAPQDILLCFSAVQDTPG